MARPNAESMSLWRICDDGAPLGTLITRSVVDNGSSVSAVTIRLGHMFESVSADDSRPADALDLAGLEGLAPGPELAALVERIDPGSVTDGYDLVEIVAACRRLKAWADAVEVAAAATLARHPVCHAPEADRRGLTAVRAAGQLLAARLGLAPSSACDRVTTAVQLVDELPDTVAALHQGEIDYPKAAALAVGVRQLDPPDGACDRYTGEVVTPDGLRRGLVADVEARVLPKAGRRSLRQHRDAIARAVAALAPKTLEQRHQRACEQRRVDYSPSPDGMAWLGVYGPAEDLTAIRVMLDAAVDAVKREDPTDARTADQVRVDVLAQLPGHRWSPGTSAAAAARMVCDWASGIGEPPPSTSPCRSAPWSGSTTRPASSRGTGRSRRRWHAGSPHTAPGAGCSPIPPPGSCSTTAPPATRRRRIWSTT